MVELSANDFAAYFEAIHGIGRSPGRSDCSRRSRRMGDGLAPRSSDGDREDGRDRRGRVSSGSRGRTASGRVSGSTPNHHDRRSSHGRRPGVRTGQPHRGSAQGRERRRSPRRGARATLHAERWRGAAGARAAARRHATRRRLGEETGSAACCGVDGRSSGVATPLSRLRCQRCDAPDPRRAPGP